MITNISKQGGQVGIQQGDQGVICYPANYIKRRFYDGLVLIIQGEADVKIAIEDLNVEGEAVADEAAALTALNAVFPNAGAAAITTLDASDEFTGSASLTLITSHDYIPGSGRLYKNNGRLLASSFTEATANTITLNVDRISEDDFIFDYKY
jgi:hypothetical protein